MIFIAIDANQRSKCNVAFCKFQDPYADTIRLPFSDEISLGEGREATKLAAPTRTSAKTRYFILAGRLLQN